jgi:hypothetical protein
MRARYSLFEIEISSILTWQILKFDPKDRKHRFELELEFEFPLCVIIKAVLRRRLLVLNERPMHLATKFTLVTAQNTRKMVFFFGSEKFSRPNFATPTTQTNVT